MRPPGYGRQMARKNRIQFHGANYHVGNRGVAKATVFHSDEDRHQFIATLAAVVDEHGWICSSYCLMRNHYHLTLTTPEPNLAAGMWRLNQFYAQWFNRRHDRVGHLFQARYWSEVIDTDESLSRRRALHRWRTPYAQASAAGPRNGGGRALGPRRASCRCRSSSTWASSRSTEHVSQKRAKTGHGRIRGPGPGFQRVPKRRSPASPRPGRM